MLSSVERVDDYHLVAVRNELGEEELWLLTDHDREVISQRAKKYADRNGPIIRNVTLFERVCRLLRLR